MPASRPRFRAAFLTIVVFLIPFAALAESKGIGEALDRAVEAGLDEAVVRELVERAQGMGLDEQEQTALVDRIGSAAQRGLPAGPVLEKSLEGLSKRVPADRLGTVLDALTDRLARADIALSGALGKKPGPRPETVRAGAEALRGGASDAQVAALAGLAGGDARAAVALSALSGLLDAGVPVHTADGVVRMALAREFPERQLARLDRATVTIATLTGMAPDKAAQAAASGFARGLTAVQIADEHRGIRDGMTGRGGIGGTPVGSTPADAAVSGALPGEVPGGRTLEVPDDARPFGTAVVPTGTDPVPTSTAPPSSNPFH